VPEGRVGDVIVKVVGLTGAAEMVSVTVVVAD